MVVGGTMMMGTTADMEVVITAFCMTVPMAEVDIMVVVALFVKMPEVDPHRHSLSQDLMEANCLNLRKRRKRRRLEVFIRD